MKEKRKQKAEPKFKKRFSAFMKALNKLMPYFLSILAAIVLFSLTNLAGNMGNGIKNALNGTFSNFATYFLPLFFIYHAIMWNYDIKRGICIRRLVCSIITLTCFASMQYLIEVDKYPEQLGSYSIKAFYDLGVTCHGGGVVGGIVGKVLLGLGTVFAVLIIAFVLIFMILQMVNITPAYMLSSVFKNKKKPTKVQKKQEKPIEKIKPIKPKKIEVVEDEDDELDDDGIDESKVAFLETTNVTLTDNLSYDEDEEEVKNYEDLGKRVVKDRTDHIPSQLSRYDGTTITKAVSNGKLEVTSTRIIADDSGDDAPMHHVSKRKEETSSKYKSADLDNTRVVPFEPYEPYEKLDEVQETDEFDSYEEEEKNVQKYDLEDTEDFDVEALEDYEESDEYETAEESYEESDEYDVPDEAYEESDEYETVVDSYEEEEYEKDNYKEAQKQDYSKYIANDLLDKATKPAVAGLGVKAAPLVEEKKEKPQKAPKPKINYQLPPLYLLKSQPDNSNSEDVRQELQENARIIVETLNNFKARTRIVDVTRGPTITRYELMPEPGVRVRTIEGLVDDIALNLAAKGIRIECPIPGKSAVGIEVPNRTISFVYLKDLIDDNKFRHAKSKLTCALGKSISGENIYADIESTPHLLVAGATGMGKSVCINSLLISLLYNATPDDVRLILIDPKRVELSNYNGIPHLLVPVVCEPKKSLGALQWAVTEMEERFMTIEEAGVRNIKEFNERVEKGYQAEKMARIVIVIDELADLKMAVPDIEGHITRLTQKARAAGIHIIIGTQRPSVDVLTGLIKNNIPSRIAFRVPSQIDSRTILDEVGAEKLVSKGDMLVKLVGSLAPVRVQGAFVSVDEIQDVIDFWKDSGPANYDEEVMQQIDNNAAKLAKNEKEFDDGEGVDSDDFDPEFYNALGLAVDMGKISSSLIMRKLSLGFQRASRIIDQLEECGYIGEANGSKPRDVLITKDDYQELMMRRED